MLILGVILTVTALLPWGAIPDNDPLNWSPTVHQIVVVKATSLMPPPLRRQILRHRVDILQGSLDVLRDGVDSYPRTADITDAYREVLTNLKSRANFRQVCYGLGRLSALMAEYSSPLGSGIDRNRLMQFRNFLTNESRNFPLVISREGEGYLRRGSLRDYLDYASRRDGSRAEMLGRALSGEDGPAAWRDQRSEAYGAAVLIYNDLILDSARLWLFLWQEAGGEIGDSPYFGLPAAGVER
jgi:hypothetical protein